MMKKYRVLKDYASHMMRLDGGAVIELVEQLAAWVNRDAPGTLEEILPQPPEAPPVTKMVKAPGRKRNA